MKLYSQLGHHRTLRVKLVAKLSEVEIESPILLEADLNKMKDKSPLGIFPTLEIENSQLISGSSAICRFITTKSKS
jgi:glutathione S-transferase